MSEKKILIVDDEVAILNMLKDHFSTNNYEVFAAESAEKAFEILRKESLMVMFLDLNLPDMSGIDLCRRIRKENQVAIMYAFTGYANLFRLLECRAAGFDDFFIKPVELKVLLKAAEDAFEKIERWKVFDYHLE